MPSEQCRNSCKTSSIDCKACDLSLSALRLSPALQAACEAAHSAEAGCSTQGLGFAARWIKQSNQVLNRAHSPRQHWFRVASTARKRVLPTFRYLLRIG